MMKKGFLFSAICLMLIGFWSLALAGPVEHQYGKDETLQVFYLDYQTGVTTSIGPDSGVSLVGVINLEGKVVKGRFSIQATTINLAADTVTPNGTGEASGVSGTFRYGISGRDLTVTQWQALGTSGTTKIATITTSSGDSTWGLHRFKPEFTARLGIFFVSEATSFKVPPVWALVH